MTSERTYDWNGQTHPISGSELDDREVARRVRMLMRRDLDHELVCVLARDRIMALVKENEQLRKQLSEPATSSDSENSVMELTEVPPCPFCGGVKVSVREGSTFRWIVASCDECGASAGEVRRDTEHHRSDSSFTINDADKELAMQAWRNRSMMNEQNKELR